MSKYIPNSFQMPNAIVDELMSQLGDTELRCYLLLVRKTVGWDKDEDSISLSQFQEFTGRTRPSVVTALRKLKALGLIEELPSSKFKSNRYALTIKYNENNDLKNNELVKNFTSKEIKLVKNFSETSKNFLHTKPTIQNPSIKTPLTPLDHAEPESANLSADASVAACASPPLPDDSPNPVEQNPTPPAEPKRLAKPRLDIPVQAIFDAYNAVAETGRLTRAMVLNDKRRRAIQARYREMLGTVNQQTGKVRFDGPESAVRWFGLVFGKAAHNPNWNGDNDIGFRADLDWVMRPDKFMKIIEWSPSERRAA